MKELILFGSAYCSVFVMGFQSLNVNAGRYVAAFVASFLIGVFNIALYKLVPAANEPTEIAAYLIGGPLAIVSAMYVHRKFFRKKSEQ